MYSKKDNKKQRHRRLTPQQSTQQNVPIRDFYNGMIITKDGRYVRIMEVLPITFLLKSSEEQTSIALMFRDVLKIAPASLQFTVVTLPSDLSPQLAILQREKRSETDPMCLQVDEEYERTLLESERTGVSRRFFISFEYEANTGILHRPDLDEISQWMDASASRIASALSACGNEVIHLDHSNPNTQSAEILYTLLNRRTYRSDPFNDHLSEIYDRYFEKMGERNFYVPPAEYLAPANMVFRDRRYVIIDDTYYSFAVIPSDGYNPQVVAGWLTPFINSYAGVDLNVYFHRIPKQHVLSSIRRNLSYNRLAGSETSDTAGNYESLNRAIDAGYYLKEGLSAGEDFYHMAVMITVSGSSLEEVEVKMDELSRMALQSDLSLQECLFKEEEAFFSSLPLARLDPVIWNIAKRNVLGSGAASCYPLTAFEMNDPDGIYLGRDLTTQSLAVVDIFGPRFLNANMFICGQTGAGKTFTLLLIAMRMRIKHIRSMIIAPEKEHEFRRVCDAIGGQFIQLGSGSPTRINIMEIFQRDKRSEEIIDGTHESISYLAEKISSLKTFFSLLIQDISIEEKQLLDEALMKTYQNYGITTDNRSLWDLKRPGCYKRMPIIWDVRTELQKNPRTVRLANIISILTTGSGASFNGQTNVDLTREFIVIGLEHLSSDMMPLGIFLALDYLNSVIREDRTKKKALFIDEWWKLAFNPIAAEYSMETAKTIRAYGGSLILATQQMKDVLAIDNGKFGEAVLNNCKIKILMQMEKDDAVQVKRILHLTDQETDRIASFHQGEGMLIAGDNRMEIKFQANDSEYKLITTKRSDLEEMVRLHEEEKNIEEEEDMIFDLYDEEDMFEINVDVEDDEEQER